MAACLHTNASHNTTNWIVKGIPSALEDESYFDVNKQNLIVFEDQMIDASKDKRIIKSLFLLEVLIIAISVLCIECRICFIKERVAAA